MPDETFTGKGFIEKLNRPFPFFESPGQRILVPFLFSVFIYVFLMVFQPFGLSEIEYRKPIFIAGFFAITFLVMVFSYYLLPMILRDVFNPDNWTVRKNIWFIFWQILTIGFFNWLYNATIATGYNYFSSKDWKEPTLNSLAGQNGSDPTPNKNTPKFVKIGIATLGLIGTYVEKMQDINNSVSAVKKYLINLAGSNSNNQTKNNQIKDIKNIQTDLQQDSNQLIYNSQQFYRYFASQISVLQQISTIHQIKSLQDQINQQKASLNKNK